MNTIPNKTKYVYSVSSMGRDMLYTLYSTYLIVFFTDALKLSDWELIAVGIVITIARIWDAINDPIMGIIVDNTKSKRGKFKPWILIGGLSSAAAVFLLFQNYRSLGLYGIPFVVIFTILYLILEIAYTMNDIAYWSMYPSFSTSPKEREKVGSLARVFASLGMFIVIALVPIFYTNYSGGPIKAFGIMALVSAVIFIISQLFVYFFVESSQEPIIQTKQEKTKLKDIFRLIFKNDQLVVIIIAILLFNTGYFITAALGIYYFNYDFNKYGGIEFTLFSVVLAVSQLGALLIFPALVKKISRKKLFAIAIGLIIFGYLFFMASGYIMPQNMLVLSIAGFFLFSGQGFIQVLVLVMLADTIEYGQWKLGTRNESVVFSINPFVTKLATSIQTAVVTVTLVLTGLNNNVIGPLTDAVNANPNMRTEEKRAMISANITPEMIAGLRVSMLVVPLILILLSYGIYRWKYKIDKELYQTIINDLKERVEQE
ncbi:MAG: glycoside-pentoside-hexuronide (GPH):cation symporter [Acholeplasmataceae bacterium]